MTSGSRAGPDTRRVCMASIEAFCELSNTTRLVLGAIPNPKPPPPLDVNSTSSRQREGHGLTIVGRRCNCTSTLGTA